MKTVRVAIAAIAILALPYKGAQAQIQDFPNRPVRMIVPAGPGGPGDVTARLLGNGLSQLWGKPVVVENRVGASGQIGMSAALSAPPDGHTLVLTTSGTLNMNGWLVKKLTYDPLATTHITLLVETSYALFVPPRLSINTMQEFVTWAKSRSIPPNFGYATPSYEVLVRDLMNTTGIKAQGIPYKAQGQAITDLLGGTLDVLVEATYVVQPLAQEKKIKVLMVTSKERVAMFPDVPTMQEVGLPALKPIVWGGLGGPAGIPPELVQKIADDVEKVMQTPAIQQRAEALGMGVRLLKGEAFNAYVREQTQAWGEAIQGANMEPQ